MQIWITVYSFPTLQRMLWNLNPTYTVSRISTGIYTRYPNNIIFFHLVHYCKTMINLQCITLQLESYVTDDVTLLFLNLICCDYWPVMLNMIISLLIILQVRSVHFVVPSFVNVIISRGRSRIFWEKGLNSAMDLWMRGSGGYSPGPEATGCLVLEASKSEV